LSYCVESFLSNEELQPIKNKESIKKNLLMKVL
jgi:hypothetical protein